MAPDFICVPPTAGCRPPTYSALTFGTLSPKFPTGTADNSPRVGDRGFLTKPRITSDADAEAPPARRRSRPSVIPPFRLVVLACGPPTAVDMMYLPAPIRRRTARPFSAPPAATTSPPLHRDPPASLGPPAAVARPSDALSAHAPRPPTVAVGRPSVAGDQTEDGIRTAYSASSNWYSIPVPGTMHHEPST